MKWKTKDYEIKLRKKPILMGVLNVTPDSFYDGGRYSTTERAIIRAKQLIDEGAEIIDIGGESTRPGSEPISLQQELDRVLPVIEEIKKISNIPISIDTYKSKVAAYALKAGANIVNDISGLKFDSEMPKVIARSGGGCVLMHIRGTPKDMQKAPFYENPVKEIKEELKNSIHIAKGAGISDKQIVIDPGIGFGKRVFDNLEIIQKIESFKEIGYPVLVGHSRKSFIGAVLGKKSPDERLIGTLAVTTYLVFKKVDIIRVHDIKENLEVIRIIEGLNKPEKYLH